MIKFYPDGVKHYFNNSGEFHRENGPAIEYPNGFKRWFKNGIYHREDGPAIELSNGDKYWFYYGKKISVKSQEEFERYLKLIVFI